MQTQQVPLAAIDISKFNTRKDLSAGSEDASLDDLAQSITEQGLIQPPTLRQTVGGRYEVVAGQRRILACQKLGWESIPAIVRDDLSDDQVVAVSLIENVQRAEMSPSDKARAYEALVRQYGSVAVVAQKTGVSQATIRKYLSLLQLPSALQQKVTTGGGPTGIGVMAQLATTFKDPKDMETAWGKVAGFNSETAQTVIKRSGGDVTKLEPLVDLAIEGAFNRTACGTSIDTCPHIPAKLRPAVLELVERAGYPM